jgi:propionyl-CoA synthetase
LFNRKLGARVPFKKYDVDYDAVIYGSEEALRTCERYTSFTSLYTSGTTGNQKE